MRLKETRLFYALTRGIFRGKRREAAAMETYQACIPSIQKLVDRHLLGINLKERFVLVDESIHRAFLPIHFTQAGIRRADKRYAAFFDKIIAYMNFQLGRMGLKDFVDPKKERINFHVTINETRFFDEDMNPVPAHLQVRTKTILVGWYENGDLDYKVLEENEDVRI